MDLHEFKAYLVYILSSRQPSETLTWKTKTKQNKKQENKQKDKKQNKIQGH